MFGEYFSFFLAQGFMSAVTQNREQKTEENKLVKLSTFFGRIDFAISFVFPANSKANRNKKNIIQRNMRKNPISFADQKEKKERKARNETLNHKYRRKRFFCYIFDGQGFENF
jgi:hypothetical protein